MGRNKKPEPEMEYPKDLSHFGNFADAIRARDSKLLHAEVEQTALSTNLCHFGNIAHRLGREVRFDEATMRFKNDQEADTLLTRNYRAPYVVPEKV